MWKPVSSRTPGIISKIYKLAGGTSAPVCSGLLGPYKIWHGLIWGKMTPARLIENVFLKSTRDASYILAKEGWPGYESWQLFFYANLMVRALHNFHS